MRQASCFKTLKLYIHFYPPTNRKSDFLGWKQALQPLPKPLPDLYKQAPSTEGNKSPSQAMSIGTEVEECFTIMNQLHTSLHELLLK